MSIHDLLKSRGFIYQTSSDAELAKRLEKPITLYQGFDPTAESLHLGNLLGVMALHHFQEAGHKVIVLIGGGTGMVGDPTDKNSARTLMSEKEIEKNGENIKKQLEGAGLLTFEGDNAAVMVNNLDWLDRFSFLKDFLVGTARYFSVNDLTKLDTFAKRLKNNQNLSLLEFCYPVLQAWDFLHLSEKEGCELQIGGQDQWGNIISGVELIRKAGGKQGFALTVPLLTTSSGEKMGKTDSGPLWLDAKKTSPFDFYQYLVKLPDDKVEQLLKLFTFLPLEKIEKVLKDPKKAQETLAFEVTKIVHGEEEAKKAQETSGSLFSLSDESSSGDAVAAIPEFKAKKGATLEDILVDSGALPSKSEVRRRCENNAVRLGEERVADPKHELDKDVVIRFGKSDFLRVTIN
jgi:tyrosyl-tRNA synthetase